MHTMHIYKPVETARHPAPNALGTSIVSPENSASVSLL